MPSRHLGQLEQDEEPQAYQRQESIDIDQAECGALQPSDYFDDYKEVQEVKKKAAVTGGLLSSSSLNSISVLKMLASKKAELKRKHHKNVLNSKNMADEPHPSAHRKTTTALACIKAAPTAKALELLRPCSDKQLACLQPSGFYQETPAGSNDDYHFGN